MNETYEVWVMMNNQNDVITEEYDTPEKALEEMTDKWGYTLDHLRENCFTLNKLLCTDGQWLECLEEIEY